MTPRERAEASVLVRQQGPRVVDVQSDTNIVLMRSYSVLDAEVRAGWLRDMVERAIIADRAEQAAGEAERVREAVAAERERMGLALADAIELADEGWGYVDNYFRTKWDFAARITDLRARAASPVPEPVAAERAERCSVCGRPTTVGEEFGGPCVYASDAACAERAVVEAAVEAWRDGLTTATDDESNTLIAAVDALAAARQDGAR